jgi:hypothetical protein
MIIRRGAKSKDAGKIGFDILEHSLDILFEKIKNGMLE